MGMVLRLMFGAGLLFLGVLPACGDDSDSSGPSGRKSSLTVSDVTMDQDGKLGAAVFVSVKNEAGEPMEGVELILETSRPQADEVVEGPSGVTDVTGGAMFHLRTSKVGSTDVKVTLVGRDVILGPVTVDFTLDAALYVGKPLLVDPGVHLDGRVVISDGQGPLGGLAALVRVSDSEVVVSQDVHATDDTGSLRFSLASSKAKSVDVGLEVSGLQGRIPVGKVELKGPTIRGLVTGPLPPGVVDSLRVGVFYVDFLSWRTLGVGNPQEIASQAVSLDASGTAAYELELPIQVPEQHLTDTGNGFSVAVYMVILYDDVGISPEEMDLGDLLVGGGWQLPQLVFLRGDPQQSQGYEPGYNFSFVLQSVDLAPAEPWDDWSSSMDLAADQGRVPQVTVRGKVACSGRQCDGQDWVVAALLLDMTATADEVWRDGRYDFLGSMPLPLSNGAATSYSFDLPDLTSHEHYADWAEEVLPSATANGLALVVFEDLNGDGLPTPLDGEPLVLPTEPWGVAGPLGWYLHPGFDWGLSLVWADLHAGYSLFLLPLELDITAVYPAEHRIVLDGQVEAGHSGYHFRILRDTADGRVEVVSGADLDTGAGGNEVTTNQDLSGVQPGDRLQITEIVEDLSFVGFDDVDFSIH